MLFSWGVDGGIINIGGGRVSRTGKELIELSELRSAKGITFMSSRDELARVIANDPRYTLEAYALILESLSQARQFKLKNAPRDRPDARSAKSSSRKTRPAPEASGKPRVSGHVNAAELCDTLRKLALRQYGLLAATVLAHWGVRSTSDVGNIVYNMIEARGLEKTESDSRSDFDNLFDFETVFKASSQEAIADAGSKPTGDRDSPED
jgi:uncharacterized repeat protein (TIGR04138 family)